MNIQTVKDYLFRTIGIEITGEVTELSGLPFFIRKQFDFFKTFVLDRELCFLLSKKSEFSQHSFQELISCSAFFYEQTDIVPVFVFQSMTKQQRLELIKQKIAFIVPDRQMYMPFLALDFTDRIPQTTPARSSALRPAAQAIIIQQLLSGQLEGLTVNQAAKIMGYTAMGTLRAADQLNDLGICEVHYNGFSKTLRFPENRKSLWEKALPFLRNPVKKILAVEEDFYLKDYPVAGEYALSLHSDLAVTRKTYAIHQSTLTRLLDEKKICIAYSRETGCADIQVFSYTLPIWEREVDLLSLELSFKNNDDARIKIALLNLEEQRKW